MSFTSVEEVQVCRTV